MDVITSFPAYFFDYLHTVVAMPNIIYAGVIALLFGIMTARTPGVIFSPVIAAIVYIAALAVIPPLLAHTGIVAPAFDKALLEKGIALYVIFLVADTVVFGIKKAVMAIFGL
jgi:hypothetical protein